MSNLRPSHKPTREGPLLVLSIAIVCAVSIPLYQWSSATTARLEKKQKEAEEKGETVEDSDEEASLLRTAHRAQQMLLGPEKLICFCAFIWGSFILVSRYLEIRRQRGAFNLDLLPTDEGARILPEDARPMLRKLDQSTRGRPYILGNMIRLALNRYVLTRRGEDVNEAVRTQADLEMGRFVSGMATMHYIAWAIPALGFLGTVRGLGLAMANPKVAIEHLYYAFDTTLVALVVSLPLMYLLHKVQRDEEALVLDCQQFCLEHLVARLYEPDPVSAQAD